MIILTCANQDTAKDYRKNDSLYKRFSFRSIIEATAKKSIECGYIPTIFDLGSLGIGEKFVIKDQDFEQKGYYSTEVIKGYKSKSLFKPELVRLAMARHPDTVVYLDGDAQLINSIGEIQSIDYDIGVTLRPKWETESDWHKKHFEIVKFINAGVIFFNPTDAARHFVDHWAKLTDEVGNDQMALNQLTSQNHYPKALSVEIINGVRVKYFPCEQYNFYFFTTNYPKNAKILHFKGDVRNFFPFITTAKIRCLALMLSRTIYQFFTKLI